MADKKPTYDELLKFNQDSVLFSRIVNSIWCFAGGFLGAYCLTIVGDLAMMGLSTLDPINRLPPVLAGLSILFLFSYLIWHVITRSIAIWADVLEDGMGEIAEYIDRFFRAQAKAFASLDKDDEPKAVQTKLVEK